MARMRKYVTHAEFWRRKLFKNVGLGKPQKKTSTMGKDFEHRSVLVLLTVVSTGELWK